MLAVVPDVAVVPARYVLNRQLYFVFGIVQLLFLFSLLI